MSGRPWTVAEDDYLRDEYGTRLPAAIGLSLGRTATAVRVRAKRLGISARGNRYTATAVADLFGIDRHKVVGWVTAGLLPGRRSRIRTARSRMWLISERGLDGFITHHPELYDWRRMALGWHRDLARRTWEADPLLSMAEVARLRRVGYECIRNHVASGRLPAVRGRPLGKGGHAYSAWVRRSDALAWSPLRPELVGHKGRGWARKEGVG